jgi:hypothetical protein
MADNLTTQTGTLATIPGSTVIATDQLGTGEHVQFVKIMDGTLDGTTKAAVGANGLKVDGSGVIQPATLKPATSGGLSLYRLLAAATTNANSVKGSAGQLYGWYLYNNAAAAKFVKLYNKATAPTVGTDTPVLTIPLPAGAAANVFSETGLPFATGIAIAITGAVADADTTAVAANDVVVNLFYA